VSQVAASILQEQREAAGSAISRDAATRRVQEAIARWNPAGGPDDTAWVRRELLIDIKAGARWVKRASDPRTAARNVIALVLAGWVVKGDQLLLAAANLDPAVRRALADWARDTAENWMNREVASIRG
jgi:hypothetical protein